MLTDLTYLPDLTIDEKLECNSFYWVSRMQCSSRGILQFASIFNLVSCDDHKLLAFY